MRFVNAGTGAAELRSAGPRGTCCGLCHTALLQVHCRSQDHFLHRPPAAPGNPELHQAGSPGSATPYGTLFCLTIHVSLRPEVSTGQDSSKRRCLQPASSPGGDRGTFSLRRCTFVRCFSGTTIHCIHYSRDPGQETSKDPVLSRQ